MTSTKQNNYTKILETIKLTKTLIYQNKENLVKIITTNNWKYTRMT